MTPETIKSLLNSLRLNTAARELQDVLSKQQKSIHLGWVCELLEREV